MAVFNGVLKHVYIFRREGQFHFVTGKMKDEQIKSKCEEEFWMDSKINSSENCKCIPIECNVCVKCNW